MARELVRRSLPSGRTARVVMSETADGDAAVGDVTISGSDDVPVDQAGPRPPWTTLHQVHGTDVIEVEAPGARSGSHADAAVTSVTGSPIAVRVADCMPVALLGDRSVGVVHAGWRGLRDGVVEHTIDALVALDSAPVVEAVVGPHIEPCCYEFGEHDLGHLVDRFGPTVRSTTTDGRPALDLTAALMVVLERAGVPATFDGACTSCDERYWSFRADATTCRQAMVAWTEEG